MLKHSMSPATKASQPLSMQQHQVFSLHTLVLLVSRLQAGCRMSASRAWQHRANLLQASRIRKQEVSPCCPPCRSYCFCHGTYAQSTLLTMTVCPDTAGLRLQQAAEQLLPSSSSDEDSEDGTDQPAPPAAIPAARAADTDTGTDESPHRKHKRRREHSKHKKQKKYRYSTTYLCLTDLSELASRCTHT